MADSVPKERRAFVLTGKVDGTPLKQLNQLLAEDGWDVKNVYPSQGSDQASWLVLVERLKPAEKN